MDDSAHDASEPEPEPQPPVTPNKPQRHFYLGMSCLNPARLPIPSYTSKTATR